MTDAPSSADLLVVLTDFPGEHYRIAAELGRTLSAGGIRPAYLLTSRYMERFKGEDFAALGPTFHLSELLRDPRPPAEPPPDQWWLHPSFVRQEYLAGRPLLRREDYGPLRAAVEHVFDAVRPTLVWSEPPTNATLAVVHHAATDRGVTYWGVGPGRAPGTFHLSRDIMATDLVESGGEGVPAEPPTGRPDYMRHTLAGRPEGIKRASLPARLAAALRAGSLPGRTSPETGWGPAWQGGSILRRFQRAARGWAHRLVPPPWDDDRACLEAEPAFLFPLHVRPEASTSMWARFHEDDAQTVRNLAFSLPAGASLVVKEHPAAVGLRPGSFYRALSRLPGVLLARPGLDAKAEVGRFAGVVALTSTLGFEALLAGVPVLVLGRIFYEGYPGATRAAAWDDVTPWMRRAAAAELATDPEGVWRAYRRHLFPGRFDVRDPGSSDPGNVRLLAAPIVAFLEGRG